MTTGLLEEWMNTVQRVRAEEHAYAAEVRRLAEEIARRRNAAPDYEGVAARFKAFHQGSTWDWRRCMWVCRAFLAAEGSLDWERTQALTPDLAAAEQLGVRPPE
jgi:hypothetical protein